MMRLVYTLLSLLLLRWIVVYKVYNSISVLEFKRRAKLKDPRAVKLYKVAAYKPTLDILLWKIGTTAASLLVIWAARTNWWLAAIAVAVISWLAVWPRFSADNFAGRVAAFFVPFDSRIVSLFDPILRPFKGLFPIKETVHTGVFEKKDLLDLLGRQNKQVDNRVEQADLVIAHNSMTFGDKKVGSIMTPRRQVKLVNANDTIGPLLMDELHKSGFSRFPVVKDSAKAANPQVVGTLYLNNLIGYEGGGKIKDMARKDVYFINEDSSLRQALAAFLKTHHHLLIVVNSFEEMVGIISLEDVLEQILGKEIVDEFDAYENLRAVATMDAHKEQTRHAEVKSEQTTETVVE